MLASEFKHENSELRGKGDTHSPWITRLLEKRKEVCFYAYFISISFLLERASNMNSARESVIVPVTSGSTHDK